MGHCYSCFQAAASDTMCAQANRCLASPLSPAVPCWSGFNSFHTGGSSPAVHATCMAFPWSSRAGVMPLQSSMPGGGRPMHRCANCGVWTSWSVLLQAIAGHVILRGVLYTPHKILCGPAAAARSRDQLTNTFIITFLLSFLNLPTLSLLCMITSQITHLPRGPYQNQLTTGIQAKTSLVHPLILFVCFHHMYALILF